LQIRGEVAPVALPQLQPAPVVSGHSISASHTPAITVEFRARVGIAHGAVAKNLFSWRDFRDRKKQDPAAQARVRLEGVLYPLGSSPLGGKQIVILAHLQGSASPAPACAGKVKSLWVKSAHWPQLTKKT